MKNPRRFIIFPEPTPADPAWVMPVVEVHEEAQNPLGEKHIIFDEDELIALLTQMRRRQANNAGAARGRQEILDLFGISADAYHAKMRERYSAQAESEKP